MPNLNLQETDDLHVLIQFFQFLYVQVIQDQQYLPFLLISLHKVIYHFFFQLT